LSLFWARPIQCTPPHPISTISILKLSTHLLYGLPSCPFLSGFPTSNPYVVLFSSICPTCPTHLIIFVLIIVIILDEDYKSYSSLLCSFPHPPVTYPSLIQIFSSAPQSLVKIIFKYLIFPVLFWNTWNLFSLHVINISLDGIQYKVWNFPMHGCQFMSSSCTVSHNSA
jgi:hypothetical protein